MKKILGNKKAISTILAALLMVVIVVVASVMVYAWSTGLLGGLLVHPTTGNENLTLENFAFGGCTTSCTTATLSIRNIGQATTNLVTYYAKDTVPNTYALSCTSGTAGCFTTAAAAPNQILTATITIAAACPSSATCTYNGATYTTGAPTGGFAFATGSYEITVITANNQQFVFRINR